MATVPQPYHSIAVYVQTITVGDPSTPASAASLMRFMVYPLVVKFGRTVIRGIGLRLNIVELRLNIVELFLDTPKPVRRHVHPHHERRSDIASHTAEPDGPLPKIEIPRDGPRYDPTNCRPYSTGL